MKKRRLLVILPISTLFAVIIFCYQRTLTTVDLFGNEYNSDYFLSSDHTFKREFNHDDQFIFLPGMGSKITSHQLFKEAPILKPKKDVRPAGYLSENSEIVNYLKFIRLFDMRVQYNVIKIDQVAYIWMTKYQTGPEEGIITFRKGLSLSSHEFTIYNCSWIVDLNAGLIYELPESKQ